ncbi:MAG TPA: hypothetical protein VMV94_19540, partial [Phycisphaerae bacterium]|nr:hypothetical protein [Phycisphaerae bacterium]
EYLAARAHAALLIYKAFTPLQMVWQFTNNFWLNVGPRYQFLQCDDMSAHEIPGVGQHLLIWAPFYVIGLATLLVGWFRHPWRLLLLVWLLLYPIPAAICADWNPHPMRTVGGMLLFPIIAATGGDWLWRRAAAWEKRLRRVAGSVIMAAVLVNSVYFANVYFREFRIAARPGYQTALVEAIQYVTRHADEADFILVTNYTNQPYIYVLWYAPIKPRELSHMPIVAARGLLGFHQVMQVGKYYFAPKNFPDAERIFREEWQHIPAGAEGFVIDYDFNSSKMPGQIVRRILAAEYPGQPPLYLEIRRWRIGETPATMPGERPATDADGRFPSGGE